jgi:hypothetical protein
MSEYEGKYVFNARKNPVLKVSYSTVAVRIIVSNCGGNS